MPVVSAEKLMEIAEGLLLAAGASQEEAKTIAKYNIGANLVGHDSHGIILIPTYIDRIKVGHIVPQAPWTITIVARLSAISCSLVRLVSCWSGYRRVVLKIVATLAAGRPHTGAPAARMLRMRSR